MNPKKILLRVLNRKQLDYIREKQMNRQLSKYYRADKKRFKEHFSSLKIDKLSKEKLDARVIFFTHSLEKGLSHQNFRKGFGITALTELSKVLFIYKEKGLDLSSPIIVNAFSTLNEYKTVHTKMEYPLDYFNELFVDFVDEINECKSKIGGTKIINLEEKEMNERKNFADLSFGRFTIRNFSDKNDIDVADLDEAVSIAMKTPSVCNRQPSRIYLVKNRDLIKKVLDIQGGFKGYELPPYLFLITASLNSFISPNERNEGYIDGGLFSMSLLYALEYKKIAACALNAMFSEKQEATIRGLLGVKESEIFIMFIAAGNFLEENLVAKSYRIGSKQITQVIE